MAFHSARPLVVLALAAVAACGGGDASSAADAVPADAPRSGGSDAARPGVDAVVPVADAAGDAAPRQFYWADWTAATVGAPGSATGQLAPPSGAIDVTYAGEVLFAQTDGGTNYWEPGDPYVNLVTANAPDQPDIVGMNGMVGTYTLTFSAPVEGLVMGIVSLGQPSANVKYVFDSPIALLSYGTGYWGSGVIELEGVDTISGSEGHGAIQFLTPVSSVSWNVVGSESWHGFTIGVPDQAR